jgi:hypothetical protein
MLTPVLSRYIALVPLFITLSCFSCNHVASTWSRSVTESLIPILLVSPLLRGPFMPILVAKAKANL